MDEFVCSSCGKSFPLKATLTRHVKNVCELKIGTAKNYPCPICTKVFSCELYLKTHLKRVHTKPPVQSSNNKLSCKICLQSQTSEESLMEHARIQHGGDLGIIAPTQLNSVLSSVIKFRKTNYKCWEEGCESECFNTMKDWRTHLVEVHDKVLKKSIYEFSSYEDFNSWKDDIEAQIGVKYFKSRTGRAKLKWLYVCNRSGVFKPRGEGIRKLKSQGSCKIGGICGSSIELFISDGLYTAIYFEDHFGHTLSVQHDKHAPIPKSTKQFVADKLAQKVPAFEVLKMLKENPSESERTRQMTMDDIRNIEKSYNITANRAVIACKSKQLAENLINEHQKHTLTKYTRYYISKAYGTVDWKPSENSYIYFKRTFIPFTGSPFVVIGSTRLECHQGKDNHDSEKRKKKDVEQSMEYEIKRRRSTMPIGCPALVIILRVATFLDKKFQIIQDTKMEKEAALTRLRFALSKQENVTWEDQYYVQLPNVEDHLGHTITAKAPATHQTVFHPIVKHPDSGQIEEHPSTRVTVIDPRVKLSISEEDEEHPDSGQDEELSVKKKRKKSVYASMRKCIEQNNTFLKLLPLLQDEESLKHVEATLKSLNNYVAAHAPQEIGLASNTLQINKRKNESDSPKQIKLMESINMNDYIEVHFPWETEPALDNLQNNKKKTESDTPKQNELMEAINMIL